MSLRAGRVGVAPSEVDEQGHIVGGGGGGSSYTKAETDTLLAAKANKSTLTANSKEFNFAYDATTQKYGYKAGADGEFVPFEGAGGGQGLVLDNLITTGLTFEACSYVKGGYQIVDGILYIDITVIRTGSDSYIKGFPTPTAPLSYGTCYRNTPENVAQLDDFITSGGQYDNQSVGLTAAGSLNRYNTDPSSYRFIVIGNRVASTANSAAKSTKKSTKAKTKAVSK